MKRLLSIAGLACALAVAPSLAAPAAAQNKIYVVHGIPGVPVNVWVNGAPAGLNNFTFGSIAGPLALGAADYVIELKTTDDSAVIYAETLTVPAGDELNISIAAHLNAAGAPDLTAFVNANSPIASGEARLGVRHAAAAPAVDVVVSGNVPRGRGGVLLPGVISTQGAVLDVPVNDYAIWLRVSRDRGEGNARPVLKPVNLKADDGQAYYIFAVGSAAEGTFQYLVQVNP